jgi:hypothetical protein
MSKARLRAFAGMLSCLVATTGCGEEDPNDGGADAGDTDAGHTGGSSPYAYSACATAERVGGFVVDAHGLSSAVLDDPRSNINGEVKDGVVPANVPDPVTHIGDCTLVRGRNLACSPLCELYTTCDVDGSCIPEPRNQDVGTVTIAGVKHPMAMEPLPPMNNYEARGTLQYPEADEGTRVTLSATGGTLEAFELVAEGVALLELDGAVTLADGMPMVVNWMPPAQPGRSRVLADLNIALHGGDPVHIECDAPDTGSLEISAELISELLSYAFSGNPRLFLERRTADSVELDVGCVELTVGTHDVLDVEIEGYVSCSDMAPCPMGQLCGQDQLCR